MYCERKFLSSDEVKVVRGTVCFNELPDKVPPEIGKGINHCNTAYRREVLGEFPFDRRLRRGDDADMGYRVSRKYPIHGCKEARVLHYGTFDKNSWQRALNYARADLYLLAKHRSPYMLARPLGNVAWNILHLKLGLAAYKIAALLYVIAKRDFWR